MDIPDQITKARLSAGMKQNKLAKALGMAKSSVSMMESGKYEFPAIKLLERIADVTGNKLLIVFYKD